MSKGIPSLSHDKLCAIRGLVDVVQFLTGTKPMAIDSPAILLSCLLHMYGVFVGRGPSTAQSSPLVMMLTLSLVSCMHVIC